MQISFFFVEYVVALKAFYVRSVDPFNFLAVFPDALPGLAIFGSVSSLAMLLTVFPWAVVTATVRPLEYTLAMASIRNEEAFILIAFLRCELALATHLAFSPLTDVDFAVSPVVLTIAIDVTLLEQAIVE